MAVANWSTTSALNVESTGVSGTGGGVSIAEGMAPSDVNNAMRDVMSQLATFFTATSLTGNLTLTSTDAGATAGPIITLYRNSASPLASDVIGQIVFQGEDSAGNTQDYAHDDVVITDVTSTSEDATRRFRVSVAGTMTTALQLASTGNTSTYTLVPLTNDGAALGSTTLGWSDLHLATGAVINYANGDAVLTHSAGLLTLGTGDLRITTAGTNSASVVTVGGTQTLTAKTLTSPTIGTSPTAAGATWTSLGTVTTVDINGGTIDGTVIGGTSAAAISGTTGTFSSTLSATAGTFSSTVEAAATFRAAGTTAIFATTGAGTVFLRPNGSASATGQFTVDNAGAATVNGALTATGAFSATTGTFSGAVSTTTLTASANVDCAGSFRGTSAGGTTVLENLSSGDDTIIACFGGGDIHLRPAGSGSATNEAKYTTDGFLLIGKSAFGNTAGIGLDKAGFVQLTRSGANLLDLNRLTSDGVLVNFEQDSVNEGSISVASNTVSYNAILASHWSQLADGSRIDIPVGTIVESIDSMCEWPGEKNDRLPKFKISDTPGSKAVYGFFLGWDGDDDRTNDAYIAAVGAGWLRMAPGQVVQIGDLIESAGNGCGRVQADDIMRASTVGKVTSTTVAAVYPDGSFTVPCTIHCG